MMPRQPYRYVLFLCGPPAGQVRPPIRACLIHLAMTKVRAVYGPPGTPWVSRAQRFSRLRRRLRKRCPREPKGFSHKTCAGGAEAAIDIASAIHSRWQRFLEPRTTTSSRLAGARGGIVHAAWTSDLSLASQPTDHAVSPRRH